MIQHKTIGLLSIDYTANHVVIDLSQKIMYHAIVKISRHHRNMGFFRKGRCLFDIRQVI